MYHKMISWTCFTNLSKIKELKYSKAVPKKNRPISFDGRKFQNIGNSPIRQLKSFRTILIFTIMQSLEHQDAIKNCEKPKSSKSLPKKLKTVTF